MQGKRQSVLDKVGRYRLVISACILQIREGLAGTGELGNVVEGDEALVFHWLLHEETGIGSKNIAEPANPDPLSA
jgi:hypothetical protein